MSEQAAVAEIARLWDLLPMLVGGSWSKLESPLTDALEDLAAADTDAERHRLAGDIMALCLPYPTLRAALAEAFQQDDKRGAAGELVPWSETAGDVTTSLARSARPGGDRWLTADVPDHPPAMPWRAGVAQVLTIAVSARDDRPPDSPDVPDHALCGTGEDGAVLTVELRGDADIETLEADLVLPRTGPSPNGARFRVTPHPGVTQLVLTAVVTRRDTRAFVQILTLTISVAPNDEHLKPVRGLRERADGWPLDQAFGTDGADATLVVSDNKGLLLLPHGLSATLDADPQDLRTFAEGPRRILQAIVGGALESHEGDPLHQRDITIPQADYERALAELIDAGSLLYNSLFSSTNPELPAIGRALAELSTDRRPLRVEIASRNPIVPWHLLAFPHPNGAVAPSRIFGLRHRIAYVPHRSGVRHRPPSANLRPSDGPLRVVLALNRDIDKWRGVRRDLVERQLTSWRGRESTADGALTVAVPAEEDVLNVLLCSQPPAEIVYFFCHADLEVDPLGLSPEMAALRLTDPHKVSLRDLLTRRPPEHALDPPPLIVLNACATAVPPSHAYAAFTPWLMKMGARGIIGTEVEIPAVFAAAWATEFFQTLLDGVPVADAAFRVTRDFVDQHHNLLGLAYAMHCDGRSRVIPAVPGVPTMPAEV